MRTILYVVDSLIKSSGITSVLLSYIKNINRSNFKISVLICGDEINESIVEEIKQYCVDVYIVEKPSIKNFFRYKHILKDFFVKNIGKFEIVHSHFCYIDNLLFSVAKECGVRKCISHSHNTRFSDHFFRSIRNRILCLGISKKADLWLACSKEAGEFLFGKKFSKSEKGIIIRNGIDTRQFYFSESKRNQIKQSLSIGDHDFVVGTVGGLRKQKNHMFLLRLIYELNVVRNKQIKLVIVGEGELKQKLEKKAFNLGISKFVSFCGEIDNVFEFLNSFDLFLFPSLYEGLGMALVEAQYNGLYCLASNRIPYESKISDNVCFLDLKKGEWADKIEGFIAADARKHVTIVSDYDIGRVIKQLESMYKSL